MIALALAGLAWVGWALALAALLVLRHRAAVVADAEHELRGAATTIGLAVERLERGGSLAELGPVVRLELARMGAALGDLGGAVGGRGVVRGRAAPREPDLDVGRLAQVLGNVVANAAEHGIGPVDVRSWREPGLVRLEISNPSEPGQQARPEAGERPSSGRRARASGRGRGLAIAERAARALGGRVRVESGDGVTRAVVELPAEREDPPEDDLRRAA